MLTKVLLKEVLGLLIRWQCRGDPKLLGPYFQKYWLNHGVGKTVFWVTVTEVPQFPFMTLHDKD